MDAEPLEPNKISEGIQQTKRTRVGNRRSRIFSHNTLNKIRSNSSNTSSTIGIITSTTSTSTATTTTTSTGTNTTMKTINHSHGKKKKNENDIMKEKENKNKSKKEKDKKTEKEKEKEKNKKLENDSIRMVESNETFDLTSKRINDYHQTPMVYTYEEPITEENEDGVKNMLHNLPNMVNEAVTPKDSIRKRNNSKCQIYIYIYLCISSILLIYFINKLTNNYMIYE